MIAFRRQDEQDEEYPAYPITHNFYESDFM